MPGGGQKLPSAGLGKEKGRSRLSCLGIGQRIMRAFLLWVAGLAATAMAVTVCYIWLDRPIALWVHGHLRLGYRGSLAPLIHLGDRPAP